MKKRMQSTTDRRYPLAMTDPTTGPEADARRAALIAKIEKHNGTPLPASRAFDPNPDETAAEQEEWKSPLAEPPGDSARWWPLVIAVLWAVTAIIVGLVFIFGVNGEAYGGDAYTGIEASIVAAVHAVGWVIISTGVLGVVIAGSRVTERK